MSRGGKSGLLGCRMLKVRDLAARWGISHKTIYAAIQDGSFGLPVTRVGSKLILIPLAAVERAEQGRDVLEDK